MRRATLSLAVAGLLTAGLASCGAQTTVDGRDGQAPESARARVLLDRAAALVAGDPRSLGYRVVAADPRGDVRAQVDHERHTITIFVRTGDAPHRIAHDLAHEMGHAYDVRHLTDTERAAWLHRRLSPRTTWWPGGAVSDYRSGAGDFAEVFALCHAASPEFRSRVAPRPADPCALLPPGARDARALTIPERVS